MAPININAPFNPAALQSDGAYVFETIQPASVPVGQLSGTVAMPGSANWGEVGVIQAFTNYDSGEPLYGDTQVALSSGNTDYSFMARANLAGPECTSFLGLRVTDGTDVAATGTLADQALPASGHNIISLTGYYTGSLGNRIAWRCDLVSGTTAASPVYRFTVFPPVGNAEVFSGIVGYAALGGAYNATAFTANFLAAINGTGNAPGSKWLIAAAAPSQSTQPPYTAANGAMSGGTDGVSGLTDASIQGTDGLGAARTGMYAFRGQIKSGNMVLPGVTTYSVFAALAGFCQQELCAGYFHFPKNTSTSAAVAAQATNSLKSMFVMLLCDFVEYTDPATGATKWMGPSAKAAGITAQQPPWKYSGNKPVGGTPNVLATESTIELPITVGSADAGLRETNGINWIGNPIPRGNVFGLYHGMMSDGVTPISDLRMAFQIALNIENILGQYVGEMQSDDSDDATRSAARGAVNQYMNSLLPPNQRQIAAYEDVLDNTDNTPQTIAEGIMLCDLEVQTMSAVRFAVAAAQVGSGLQISVGPTQ